MPKVTLFIGSSTASKSQAKAIIAAFQNPMLDFIPWWDAFNAGGTLLDSLDKIANQVDGALLLLAPESESIVRGNTVNIPNLNVLYELGYFNGKFGRDHVAMIKYGEFYLPTDFGGYIHIPGGKYFKRGAVTKVGKRTQDAFYRWIAAF